MSTTIDRTTEVRGAGTVKLGSDQFFDKGGIKVTPNTSWNEIKVSGYGKIDDSKGDETIVVAFTPAGEITAAIIAALYPYGATAIDASIFGATDTVAEIHSMLGKKLTLHNAALTKMPSLKLGAQETPIGEAELTALIKNSTARTVANSLYTLADAAFAGTFDKSKVIKASYSGVWNSIDIVAAESWDIEFDLSVSERKTDDIGTYDMGMVGLTVKAKCKPTNMSESLLDQLRMQGAAPAAIGSSARQGHNLVITSDIAGGIDITLNDAMFKEGPLAWGEDELRAGEIGFEASRDLTSGFGSMFTIGVQAAA